MNHSDEFRIYANDLLNKAFKKTVSESTALQYTSLQYKSLHEILEETMRNFSKQSAIECIKLLDKHMYMAQAPYSIVYKNTINEIKQRFKL